MTEGEVGELLEEQIDTLIAELDNPDLIVVASTGPEAYRAGVTFALNQLVQLRNRFG